MSVEIKTKKHVFRNVLLTLLILLFVARLFLPWFVLKFVNKRLSEMSQYTGHVDDIDIWLIRGAYVIKNIKIEKLERRKDAIKDTIPFFTAPVIDLSVQWKSLFKGALVGEIYVEDPILNFVRGKHKGESVKRDTADFRGLIKDLMPLTVNYFQINKAEVHYIDFNIHPKVDIYMEDLNIAAENLSNVNKSIKLLPASLKAHGKAYGGVFVLNANFDGLNPVPTFDLNAEFKSIDLVRLNNFFSAYGNFEVENGYFGLYSEFAAKKGLFGGYVKPIIKDFKVKKTDESLKQDIWELILGVSAKVLENRQKEQLASKIPINGKFDDPDVNIWRAVSFVLRNAFVYALKPTIDHTININKLEEKEEATFLEKIFPGKNRKTKQKNQH